MKKMCSVLSCLIIGILTACLLAVVFLKLVFGAEFKAVTDDLMKPQLPAGSMILILPAEYEQLKTGDIITYVRDENLTLVTRKIVKKDDKTQSLTTCGLTDGTNDRPTLYKNVVGKVCLCMPLLGYVLMFTETAAGKTVVVTLIIVLTTVSLMTLNRKKKHETAGKNKTETM